MPITVQYQPPFAAAGGVAYDAGWNEGTAKRREELWQRQMQMAALAQNDLNQRRNIWADQQRMMYGTAANREDLLLRSGLQQRAALMSAGLEAQQAETQFGYSSQLAKMQNQFREQQEVRSHEQAVQDKFIDANAQLRQIMGSIDPEQVAPQAQEQYRNLQARLTDFDKVISSGDKTSRDLYYTASELLGRAAVFKMPGMIQPKKSREEMLTESLVTKPGVGTFLQDVATGKWSLVKPDTTPSTTVDPVTGNIMGQGPDGPKVIFDANEGRENIRKSVADSMLKERIARISAYAGEGTPPDPWAGEEYQKEFDRRFAIEWNGTYGAQYGRAWKAGGGIPMAAPEGGLPQQPAMGQPVPGVPQGAPAAPAPPAAVTAAQPSGVSQPAPAAPQGAAPAAPTMPAAPPDMGTLGESRQKIDSSMPHNPLLERQETWQPTNIRALRGTPLPNESVKPVLHEGQFDKLQPGEWFFHPETGEPVQKGRGVPMTGLVNKGKMSWKDEPFKYRRKQLNVKWIPDATKYSDWIISVAPKIPANGISMIRNLQPGDYFAVVYPDGSKHLKVIPPDVASTAEYLKDLQKNIPVR